MIITVMMKLQTKDTVKHEIVHNEESDDGNSFDEHESKEFGVRTRSGRILRRPTYLKDYL